MNTQNPYSFTALTLCACFLAAPDPAIAQGSEALLSELGFVGPSEVRGGTPVRLYLGYTVDNVNFLPTFTTVSVNNAVGSPLEPLLVGQPLGAVRLEIDIPTSVVPERQRVTVRAVDDGVVKTVLFTVLPPEIASFNVAGLSFEGGTVVEGRIQLASPASAAGAVIGLGSSDPAAAVVPLTAAVSPGQSLVKFPVVLKSVASPRQVDLTATLDPSVKTIRLTINPASLVHLENSSAQATGGNVVEGLVVLSSPSPPAGLNVTLRSSDPAAASVPASVSVAPGSDEVEFTVTTAAVSAPRSVTISATLRSVTLRETLTVLPPALTAVRLAPRGLLGGRKGSGAVELSGRTATVAARVVLRSSRPDLVEVPGDVVIPPGAISAPFVVTAAQVAASEAVDITATYANQEQKAVITLIPARKGDWDGDGDVDLRDFVHLQLCFEGSKLQGAPVPAADCRAAFDFDVDDDIDHTDYLAFEGILEGPDEGPRTRVELDAGIVPLLAQLPGWSAGAPRPVAGLIDQNGRQADFVSNELLLVTDDANKVSSFIQRWNGREVFTFKPRDHGRNAPVHHIIRVDTTRSDGEELEDDLKSLSPEAGGLLRVSSRAGLGLLGIAASEAAAGLEIAVNWVVRADGIRERSTPEAPVDPLPFGGYVQNSYEWQHLLNHKVPEAWRALDLAGRLGNKIPMAVIDGGFAVDADWPAGYVGISVAPFYPWGSENPMSCSKGSYCPWHGTNVVSTAMGLVGNGFGAAGVAGPVAAAPITVQTLGDMFSNVVAVRLAAAAGARIINMSLSASVPAPLSWSVAPFNGETALTRSLGTLIFASAGNDGEDVDSEDCFIVCWEDTWHTPCENTGVICVGGTQSGGTVVDPGSNYGAEEVDIYAPYTVVTGPDPRVKTPRVANGTSHASPYAAGVAALIWSAKPSMTADQVEATLQATAQVQNGIRSGSALDGVVKALGGHPPSVNIVLPVDGGTFPDTFTGTEIGFLADATDPEDGVPEVSWTSSLQGPIGQGTSFVRSDLIPGTHVITAQATDSSGLVSTDRVEIRVTAVVPSLWIVKPGPQSQIYELERVFLQAVSFDRAAGSASIVDSKVSWRSNVQGALGTGHSIHVLLVRGTHTLTVRGVSANGATGEARVTVVVNPPRETREPDVVITSPANGFRGPSDRILLGSCSKDLPVSGSAIDNYTGQSIPQENMIWVTDRSDLQHPYLGQGSQAILNLAMKSCSETTVHMIRLTVTDSRGTRKSSDPQRIEITAPPR